MKNHELQCFLGGLLFRKLHAMGNLSIIAVQTMPVCYGLPLPLVRYVQAFF